MKVQFNPQWHEHRGKWMIYFDEVSGCFIAQGELEYDNIVNSDYKLLLEEIKEYE